MVPEQHPEPRIVGLDGEPHPPSSEHGDVPEQHEAIEPDFQDMQPRPSRVPAMISILAIGAIMGWSVLFALAQPTPGPTFPSVQTIAGWIGTWSVPVALILLAWLIYQIRSGARVERFSGSLRMIADESDRLEARLAGVNRELSLARQFLEAQTRDLDSLGRIAGERIATHAATLADLIRDNGTRVDTIAAVSEAALENMTRLRDHLPVIASTAKDVTNNIGATGRVAGEHMAQLVAGFERLNEIGLVSDQQVRQVEARVDQALTALNQQIDQMENTAERRFVALTARSSAMEADLIERETQAHDALHHRFDLLARRLQDVDNDLAERASRFGEQSQQQRDQIHQLLADLDTEISTQQSRHQQRTERLQQHSADIAARLEEQSLQLGDIADRGGQANARLAQTLATVNDGLAENRQALAGTETTLGRLLVDAKRLQEALEASHDHTGRLLPEALHDAATGLENLTQRVELLRGGLNEAETTGQTLNRCVGDAHRTVSETLNLGNDLAVRIADHSKNHAALLSGINAQLAETEQTITALTEQSRKSLQTAIEALESGSKAAVQRVDQESAAAISALAERVGDQTQQAVDATIAARSVKIADALEEATQKASAVSRDSALQLRDQLAKIGELTANLEQRVTQLRRRAEDKVDNDFARRVALLNEALSSQAIDIARALDRDVADSAWAGYLRGDRGIFTRRSVKLLERSEVTAISQFYDNDSDFREHVNRYVHDFEAMLRQVLSTRDGHALGVTLLSSDMGKMYVALAQAIERIRA